MKNLMLAAALAMTFAFDAMSGVSLANYAGPPSPVLPPASSLPPPMSVPQSMPASGPAFERASPFPPCAYCTSPGQAVTDHPFNDLPRYEEMNPNTDPVGRTEAVPESAE
jgi:hypothetical protein